MITPALYQYLPKGGKVAIPKEVKDGWGRLGMAALSAVIPENPRRGEEYSSLFV